jgi:hypothetical protein
MFVFAQSDMLQWVFLGALALTIGMLLLRTQRHMRRARAEQPAIVRTPRPSPREKGHHVDEPAELARWEVEMHEIARDLSARLDSKIGALRALIAEADRAAARLEAALAASGRPDRSWPAFPPTQAEGLRIRPAGPPVDEARERPEGATSADGSQHAGAEARHSPERREEIYTLSDYGFEPAEIARRTGSPIGEVELILSLRGQP